MKNSIIHKMSIMKSTNVKIALQVTGLLIILILPSFLNVFQTGLLAKFFVFSILAISYDLIWGHAGISNFGHAVFFGLGAYAFGLVSKYFSIPGVTYLAFLAAILLPVMLGIFLAVFLIYGKVVGAFFAVVTMCLGSVFENIASSWTDVTGGMNGLYDFATPKLGIPGVWEFELKGVHTPYYLIVFCLTAVLFFSWLIMKKRNFGKVISAIKNDEKRAEFLGYNVNFYKMQIFAISCGVAGLAGALYVPVATITPSILGMGMSVQILVWVAVGGRGSLWGSIIGVLIVCVVQEVLSGVLLNFWQLILGIFFILVVMLWPKGFAGLVQSAAQRLSKRNNSELGKQVL